MYNFLIALFVAINLLIRVPVRIALKFNSKNEKLVKVDLWAFIAACFNMVAFAIYGMCTGENITLAIIVAVLFGGFSLFMVLILNKSQKDDTKYWDDLYHQTNQRPNEDNYGYSPENPIWSGTCKYYCERLKTDTGCSVTWEYSKKLDLPKENGFSVLNGFYACELHEIKVSSVKGIDLLYIATKSGLDKMQTWHAPKGYSLE